MRIRGSEECKPVLASISGKCLAYADELPRGYINPEVVKPIIVHRGGAVSARYAGAWRDQSTTLVSTAI
eukprot:164943-Karenia_brevis.AAC.1